MNAKPHARIFSGTNGLIMCGPSVWNGLASSPYHLWAFLRAELSSLAGTPFRADNDLHLAMGHIQSLPPQEQGKERLSRILTQLLEGQRHHLAPHHGRIRLGAILCLPERTHPQLGRAVHHGERVHLESAFKDCLMTFGYTVEPKSICLGHAGFASAVLSASESIDARQLDAVLIAGIDTGYDAHVVQRGLSEGRIFDGENVESFCPGEGGGAVLLTTAAFARQMQWTPHSRVDGVARAEESAHLYNDLPCIAEGLTTSTQLLCRPLREHGGRLDWWIHDMTNEFYRVHEFRCAWPRSSRELMNKSAFPFALHNQLGDLGAAVMPTAAIIAGETFLRGGPQAANCMITGSSLYGERGALLISAPESPPTYAAGAS